MICPKCGNTSLKVVDKRNNTESNSVRRRRECLNCSTRFTTYERIEKTTFLVRKKSGRLEEFERDKMRNSVLKGLKKRKISEVQIGKFTEEVELALINKRKSIVDSHEIGEEILKGLKEIDAVAYMLYATVYLDFENLGDLQKEINKITK